MTLYPPFLHPHGLDEATFIEQFTLDKPVIFAFHGYARTIHEIVHGRPNVDRFHVRGFNEEGTTTTPFDMVVRNEMSRYHLALEAVRRGPPPAGAGAAAAAGSGAQLGRPPTRGRGRPPGMTEARE